MLDLTPTAKAVASQVPALCVVVDNVMTPQTARVFEVPANARIADLVPPGRFPYICRLDGEWLLRAGWGREVGAGSQVEFYSYPQGGGDNGSNFGRLILTIAAMYIAVQTGGFGIGGLIGSTQAGVSIGIFLATAVINKLVPVDAGDAAVGTSQTTSNTYNTNLSANQARLDQPIPVLYGRNKTFPDYAAEPYATYSSNDDQYFNALFCLGQGVYNIESILIDDTNVSNFSDVQVRILTPGMQPTLVSANVSNAAEVTGNEVVEARFIGPFIGCRPKTKATKIAIDISFSRGLATYDASGNPTNKAVSWRVQYRAVDDFGVPTSVNGAPSNWTTLDTPTLTAAQTEPVRRTYEYTLPTPCRPQVRLTRVTPFDPNNRVANTLEWAGMRCYLQAAAPLCPTATHIEVKMRASEQLSGLTQRKIAVVSRRRLPVWHPVSGHSTDYVETRNPAWALLDKWSNTVYGDGYPPNRYDLQTLYDLSVVWDTRQDRFDAVFSQTYDSFQADQMIAQAGRAAVFRRNAVMTVTRDEKRDLPVTAFNSRNIAPGSIDISYSFAHEGTADGVIVEYWDNRAWDWVDILCPAPGVVTPVRPQRLKLFGVTGAKHAEREGLYHAAQAYWRRKFPTFTTELEGSIPAFGSAVVFAPSLPHWGHGGEIVSTEDVGGIFKAVLSEPAAWDAYADKHFISLIRSNGSLSDPYRVTKGTSDFEVLFEDTPDFALFTQNAYSERTRYIFGAGVPYEAVLRVLAIRTSTGDDGVRTFTVSGVIEDDRVHEADVHLLPSGPELPINPETGQPDPGTQDPIDNPTDPGTGSGTALTPYLGEPFPPALGREGEPFDGSYVNLYYLRFGNDGRAYAVAPYASDSTDVPSRINSWWLLGAGPYTPVQCADFQIRATLVEGPEIIDGTMNTWLSLGTDRIWHHPLPPNATGEETPGSLVFFEIRLVATGEVLESRTIRMGHSPPFDPSASST